ncbi:MAG: hypothetical protein LKF70_11170 [Prevotella sp.]|jgi:hypothetical protein|nr:hypothetical protein [Prevotella sp.]
MSNYVVYLKVKPFIQQWLNHHYGNPVTFPVGSAENSTIRRFLAKQPHDTRPDFGEKEEVAIRIPDSKAKPVVTYNYLGPHARAAVIETIEDTFRLQLWKDLNDLHDSGCSILKAVRAWCENNGISVDYDYTIKMRYQRMRNAYLKSGVDLRNYSRNHDEK